MAIGAREIRKDEDSRKTWKQVNAILAEVQAMKVEIRRLTAAVADLRAKAGWKDEASGGDARWS